MGKTITEKILARASGRVSVFPGDYLEVSSRRPVTMFTLLDRGPNQLREMGCNRVFNPELVNVVDGHNGATASQQAGESRRAIERWAREVGIPEKNIYLLGRSGIEHVMAGEKCWALPGDCFFQAVNGHTSSLGALGAFAITLSYGSGAYLLTGKTWVKVPQTVRFNIAGKLSRGVMARDIFEYILGQLGPASCTGQVMEFGGETIEALDMDGRFSLCCNALFTGAWTAVINPDRKTLEYVRSRTTDKFEPLVSDPDAGYARVYSFDISELVPQVAVPPERHGVKPIGELKGARITNGFIGTCANSRLEDMRIAGAILKGRKIPNGVILNITPGTPEIYKKAIDEGLIKTFIEAGAAVMTPACGMCVGINTPLAAGDVCIATATCNYAGRMGSRDAQIYLASPATVAASCLKGEIADPREIMR
ncbi:MAG: aconitase family protein [Dehalococcoidales bacterium]|nr:aconitase family protein [Dehalococcoidales bacterium]